MCVPDQNIYLDASSNWNFCINLDLFYYFVFQDKKFLGVTCSTNNAEEYNLASILLPNGRLYKCTCKGESKLFFDSVDSTVCYIHYWECPLTT